LSPSGSGYFTCIQNMLLVTNKFKSRGLHEKHVVATWNLGNHLNIAYRRSETKKNLRRGGRSQDLPNTDFWPAVRHLKRKQQYTHSTVNTHKMTTIHARQLTTIHTKQLQKYTQDNYNNTHKTNTTVHTRQLTIHTRQLQQYTQDNYNSTHKTATTIHTKQLQRYTQYYNNTHKITNNNTHKTTTTIPTRHLTTIHTRYLKINRSHLML